MLTFLIWNVSQSQPNINQEVTLQYNNTPANVIFRDIQNQIGMVFSYSEFQDQQQISIQVIKKPLKDVLPILETSLNIHISIKEKYIIVKPNKDGSPKELSINGTITDPNSNEPLSDASIYVKKHRILVNSDKKGKFAFIVPFNAKQVKINIAKENYLDTSVIIVASHSQTLHIKMRSFPRQRISEFDSLTRRELQIGSLNNDPIPAFPEIVK